MSDTDATLPGGLPQEPGRGEQIVELEIERELQDSYLTYAMSTIMDRALPDVRDGLKPSQRRILVAMNDLNLRPGRKHLKCAKIAGDTSGNYHPHGEGVIYPTLVGMAQKWKMRVPLIDPQGNFGSIEGDPPAAMRYTEARMTHAAVDMMEDLKLDTVDLQPNYDDRLTEPTVLPGKFPNLLINGGMGIAVGMATSLPPHNPTEILDAIERVVDNPDLTIHDLMTDETAPDGSILRRGVKGPDFPTGGIILGRRGIVEAYTGGRGRITVRGVCHVEELKNGRQQIVIDQIPYSLMQNNLVEKIVDAVKEERIKDVSDVRNESGRQAQTRIVVELKKGADAAVVENQLYQHTPLQETFSIINISLVNRQPRTLNLREMIDLYIEHRVVVIRRRTSHLLREAKKRAHTLEALIYAVCDIDEVIRIIRASSSREEAITALMARAFRIPESHPHHARLPRRLRTMLAEAEDGVMLTRVQAEAIGGMRLIQLVGLEIEKLVNDYTSVVQEIEGYERILADHQLVLNIIKADCAEMRARYGSDRLTRIEDAAGDIGIEELIQEHTVAVTISHAGYIKRVPIDTYSAQGRGGKGIRASDSRENDFIEEVFVASTHDDLLCFTDTGRVFKLKVYEIPEMTRTSKGRAIVNLLDLREGERTCAYLAVKDFEQFSQYLTFATRQGVVKRTPLKEYRNVNRAGIIAVGINEGDSLLNVLLTSGTDDLILVTAQGSAIRFNEDDVRPMGRPASGVKGIDLDQHNEVVAALRVEMAPDPDGDLQTIDPTLSLLTITQNGYGKRTTVDEYRVQPESGKLRSQSRGGKGRADIKTTDRNGPSVAALVVHESDDIVVITRGGQLVRMKAAGISCIGRGTQGVRVVSLNEGDQVVATARIMEDEDSEKPQDSSPED
ncbi:MAG: DNA gyrase subunit A [Phycisphaeraceae bacterium]|nr:DNA gyrase subunit A [Phycisphaeraceae bacterium]MCW5755083.1 DNA gyrase subunit A [Phycisphaeraceae bacterium]